MTHKIQYSKKFEDGSIVVVGGDDVTEFEKNYNEFKASPVVAGLFKELAQKQAQPAPQPAKEAQTNGNTELTVERVTLPAEALLEVIFKGDKYHGEVSPFPGTKFPVRVWPEVLDTLNGFDKDLTATMEVGGMVVDFMKNEKGYPSKITQFVQME